MLGKNRDRVSIVAAILEVAHSGASKTRIMFGAGLSFSLLGKYLDIVLRAGFIQNQNYRYHTTERGYEFLKQYKRFEERYLRTQEMLEALDKEHDYLSQLSESPRPV